MKTISAKVICCEIVLIVSVAAVVQVNADSSLGAA